MGIPLIADIVEGGLKGINGVLGTIIGDKTKRDAAKSAVALEMAKMSSELETTYRAELALQRDVMVAELEHGDGFTKKARPSIVYAGLAIALFDGALRPLIADLTGYFADQQIVLTATTLPAQFWAVWGGVCGIYAIGRTREKIGAQPGKLLNAVFGNGKS